KERTTPRCAYGVRARLPSPSPMACAQDRAKGPGKQEHLDYAAATYIWRRRATGLTSLRMKPGDHPDFYRFAPPPGTSRESTIRLDADGKFWHDGQRVDHPALERALHGWIARHPDDGRFILTNGYDWTYFQVDDAPYTVRSV